MGIEVSVIIRTGGWIERLSKCKYFAENAAMRSGLYEGTQLGYVCEPRREGVHTVLNCNQRVDIRRAIEERPVL